MNIILGYVILAKHEDPEREWQLLGNRVYTTPSGAQRRQEEMLSHGCWEHVLLFPVMPPDQVTEEGEAQWEGGDATHSDDHDRRIRERAERLVFEEMKKLEAGQLFTAERSTQLCKMCLRIARELEEQPLPDPPNQ